MELGKSWCHRSPSMQGWGPHYNLSCSQVTFTGSPAKRCPSQRARQWTEHPSRIYMWTGARVATRVACWIINEIASSLPWTPVLPAREHVLWLQPGRKNKQGRIQAHLWPLLHSNSSLFWKAIKTNFFSVLSVQGEWCHGLAFFAIWGENGLFHFQSQ